MSLETWLEKIVLIFPILLFLTFVCSQYYSTFRDTFPRILDKHGVDRPVALKIGRRLFKEESLLELCVLGIVNSVLMILSFRGGYVVTGLLSLEVVPAWLYFRFKTQQTTGSRDPVLVEYCIVGLIGAQFFSFVSYPLEMAQAVMTYAIGFASFSIVALFLAVCLRRSRLGNLW